jgi:hypothetical protein
LTTISAQDKIEREPSSQPRGINIEILTSLSYNKQHIGVVTKSPENGVELGFRKIKGFSYK